MNRHKPFAVHGTHITDSKSKLLSRHADEDAALAEAARLQKLMVHFWDGDRPVYRDVTVEGPPVEDDVLQSLVQKYTRYIRTAPIFPTPPSPRPPIPTGRSKPSDQYVVPNAPQPADDSNLAPPGPSPDDPPILIGVDPADPDGDTTVMRRMTATDALRQASAYRMLDLMRQVDELPADVRERIERRISEYF